MARTSQSFRNFDIYERLSRVQYKMLQVMLAIRPWLIFIQTYGLNTRGVGSARPIAMLSRAEMVPFTATTTGIGQDAHSLQTGAYLRNLLRCWRKHFFSLSFPRFRRFQRPAARTTVVEVLLLSRRR